ncbi:unnamed protein product [Prorocentrum cordatum]|uniref:Reverse transcriptase Ty1/copia-type domain-containing protein n=1 Tax=Prorocentrum cordatum TaxID=2364126 RepID=A0ABN9PG14_9DINO|nr:unnamed protein product [Polarella glacialis]
MAAAHGSWREPDVARALRATYRAGLGKMAMGGRSHHKAFVAEQELDGDETIDDDDGDPECDALLADHGVHDDADPPVDERDLIDALISWKEQRKLHGKVKWGRGHAGLDLGCAKGTVGAETFEQHCRRLRRDHGLQPILLPNAPQVSFRFGNDGSQSSVGEVLLPSGILGRNAVTKWSLVPGSAPFLVSKQQIKAMKSQINTTRDTVAIADLPECTLPTGAGGHYVLSLTKFDPKGFRDNLGPMISDPEVTIYMTVAATEEQPNVIPAPEGSAGNIEDMTMCDRAGGPPPTLPREAEDAARIIIGNNHDRCLATIAPADLDLMPADRQERIEPRVESTADAEDDAGISEDLIDELAEAYPPSGDATGELTRRQRRRLVKDIATVTAQLRLAGLFALFSPERVGPKAELKGLGPAKALDPTTGWDLLRADHRREMWRQLAEDQPEWVGMSPPCTLFSILQYMNKQRDTPEYQRRLASARLLLRLCVQVAEYQLAHDRHFYIEQPQSAQSWNEPAMIRLRRQDRAYEAVGHGCQYGYHDAISGKPYRKAFRFITSSPVLAQVEVEESLQARAVLWQGLVEVPTHESLMTEVFAASKRRKKADQDVEEPPESQAEARDRRRKLETAVRKIHVNLGHPAVGDLIRILKHGNATDEAIAIARDFKCDVCEQNRAPKLSRPATVPRDIQALSEVGFDVKELLYYISGKTWAALNVVDGASSLQQMMPLAGNEENGETLRKAWDVGWRRPYGAPVRAKCDSARANTGAIMSEVLECDGVDFDVIPGEAHWLLGKAERHGSWFANILSKVIETVQPKNHQEWEQYVSTVCDQKNRLLRRSGQTGMCVKSSGLLKRNSKESKATRSTWICLLRIKDRHRLHLATVVSSWCRHLCLSVLGLLYLRGPLYLRTDPYLTLVDQAAKRKIDVLQDPSLVARRVFDIEGKPLKRLREKTAVPTEGLTSSATSGQTITIAVQPAVEEPPTRPADARQALLDSDPEHDELVAEAETEDQDVIIPADVCLTSMARTGEPCYEALLAKGRKEITEKVITREILNAKMTEWQTVDQEKHAVRVCSLKESGEIKRTRPDRLVDTRFILTIKHDPDGKELVKARWVARGFKDPDALKLVYWNQTAAPTVSQNARMLTLQLAASHQWRLQIGDIRGAFMESDPLQRPDGPLYAKQPPGGLPGLHPDQVVELVLPLHGLDDAPCRWYSKTSGWLTDQTAHEGRPWTKSRLEPCLFLLRDAQCKLCGILVVHVDDALIAGEGVYFHEAVRRLKGKLLFRKWAVGEGEYCGSVLHQDPKTFDISIRQTTPYQELKPLLKRKLQDFDAYLVKEAGSAVRHDQTPVCRSLRDNKCCLDRLWLADGLTKDTAETCDLLRGVIRTGCYQISEESLMLELAKTEREQRKVIKK